MPFPEHIERLFADFGVAADTKAALYDLYLELGPPALECFGDLSEGRDVRSLGPEVVAEIRPRVVESYLRRQHPAWRSGKPTASLYHPRAAEGRASGMALPLASVRGGEQLVESILVTARAIVGDDQPLPEGMLLLGRNAHFGGRLDTISFDVVAMELDDAMALARAEGRQHTLPGSAGETSGTYDAVRRMALLWEVQPNVLKPEGDRNREIAKIFRKHRNWHVVTLVAALRWLAAQEAVVYVLRGAGLAATHEVNPHKPVSEAIQALHDRTVERVVEAMGGEIVELGASDIALLLESELMNVGLRQHVEAEGVSGLIAKVSLLPEE